MNQYLGKGVSHIFGAEGYNYSKVVFSKGRPVLESELNLLQEVLEQQARRSTMEMPSGWLSFREAKASSAPADANSFYTQDADGAIPEVALVNGWPVVVAGTGTASKLANKVSLASVPLIKGSRADGVFLEVWRALVSDEFSGITQPLSSVADVSLHGLCALSSDVGWAVGDDGAILKTENAGLTWGSRKSPTHASLRAVVFQDGGDIGYAAGTNGTLVRTDDGGASWKVLPVPTSDDIMGLALMGTRGVCLVGTNGLILYSADGSTFAAPAVGCTGEHLRSVCFSGSLVGWAAGHSGALVKTMDGGRTWARVSISVQSPSGEEELISTQLNAVSFSNLNDGLIVGNGGLILKTTDGGLRWSDASSNILDETTGGYTRISDDLMAIAVRKSLPHEFTIKLYDSVTFSAASYSIGPTSLELSYTRRSSGAVSSKSLALASYSTSDDLAAAINAVLSDDGKRVFTVSHDYAVTAYDSHVSSGSFGAASTTMRFSVGDCAWAVGTYGTILSTLNSGAQWRQESSGSLKPLSCVSFSDYGVGWAGGGGATVLRCLSSVWSAQSTDVSTKPQRKVYYEGNVGAMPSLNPNFDSIDPSVRVATADRVQIQYRIRATEGVDLGAYQEAGLGAPYVFSQGPNTSVRVAGSYRYENMGAQSGDYGLWRARCKNTVDGYCYAIPMFLVSQRNTAAYDPASNINGITDAAYQVVRPDDQQPGEILAEDIVDLRKSVVTLEASATLRSSVESLLTGTLRTKMSRDAAYGTQVGAMVVKRDVFSSQADIAALVGGSLSSSAVGGITGFAGPSDGSGIAADMETGALPSQADLTFPEVAQSVWDPRPEAYSAVYAGSGVTGVDGYPIPGGFTGQGTVAAQFVLGTSKVLTGVDYPGLRYVIMGSRVDCSGEGLSSSPDRPLSLRNPDSRSPSRTAYYRAVDEDGDPRVLLETSSSVTGKKDYAIVDPSAFDTWGASMVEVHRFLLVSSTTNVLRVPKDFNGYTCLTVKDVRSSDGTSHRVKEIRDREVTGSSTTPDAGNLVVYIDEAYRIPAGSVVEVVLGVADAPEAGASSWAGALSLATTDRGETTDSFRNSGVTLVDRRTRSVSGAYRTVLLYASTSAGSSSVTVATDDGSQIIGLPSMPSADGQPGGYVWYTSASLSQFNTDANVWWSTVRLSSPAVSGLGTDRVTLGLGTGAGGIGVSTSGSVVVPALVRGVSLVNSTATSSAEVLYKTVVPQALDSLPQELSLDVLEVSDKMYVSTLGAGGGLPNEVYTSSVLRHVPVTDPAFTTESFLHNLFGLRASSVEEQGGLLTLPIHVACGLGGTLTLGSSSSDQYGRTFYTTCDRKVLVKAPGMLIPSARQVFLPVLARVRSSVTSPLLKGEAVLVLLSQTRSTDLANTVLIGPSSGGAVASLFRVPGMPLTRG